MDNNSTYASIDKADPLTSDNMLLAIRDLEAKRTMHVIRIEDNTDGSWLEYFTKNKNPLSNLATLFGVPVIGNSSVPKGFLRFIMQDGTYRDFRIS